MKVKRALIGVALAAGVAACGEGAAPLLPHGGPSYDGGGHTLGAGGRTGSDSSSTTSAGEAERGGHTLGGGA